MSDTLYTIGYIGWNHAKLRALLDQHNALLIDIRYAPRSQNPAWQRQALHETFGARYKLVGALGNRNYTGGPIQIAAPDRGIEIMRPWLERGACVLMCACKDHHTCHRTPVADLLADRFGLSVEHIYPG